MNLFLITSMKVLNITDSSDTGFLDDEGGGGEFSLDDGGMMTKTSSL